MIQFSGENQSPVMLSRQFVWLPLQSGSARATEGKAQSARAVRVSTIRFLMSVRGVGGADLFFMRREEVLFVEGF